MAERGMDPKVLQYVMGHASISVTMEVYNHITSKQRIEKEIKKMNDLVAVWDAMHLESRAFSVTAVAVYV